MALGDDVSIMVARIVPLFLPFCLQQLIIDNWTKVPLYITPEHKGDFHQPVLQKVGQNFRGTVDQGESVSLSHSHCHNRRLGRKWNDSVQNRVDMQGREFVAIQPAWQENHAHHWSEIEMGLRHRRGESQGIGPLPHSSTSMCWALSPAARMVTSLTEGRKQKQGVTARLYGSHMEGSVSLQHPGYLRTNFHNQGKEEDRQD